MNIFPTYLHINNNLNLANNLLPVCKQILSEINFNKDYPNGKTTYFNMNVINKYNHFEELYDYISKELNTFLSDMKVNHNNLKLKIQDIWLSEMYRNGFHPLHTHSPGSIISGNFYVYTQENSADLIFRRPDWDTDPFKLLGVETSEYTSHLYKLKAETGKIVMWKSDLPHEVKNNQSDCRIAISFNIGLDDV